MLTILTLISKHHVNNPRLSRELTGVSSAAVSEDEAGIISNVSKEMEGVPGVLGNPYFSFYQALENTKRDLNDFVPLIHPKLKSINWLANLFNQ